jgi:hypothetical protein
MFCRDTSVSLAALASRKRMLNWMNCGTPPSPTVAPVHSEQRAAKRRASVPAVFSAAVEILSDELTTENEM